MDECRESVKVLGWLKKLPKQFHILFTSRNSPVGDFLRECLSISLDSGNSGVEKDVEIFLDAEIKRFNFEVGLKARVINTLRKKAQGQ
ncbi:hypothetical protein GYMLUDRAFT_821873 [Collybiopsis luxurians FD-317 M1]|uniref:NB-ARC domain-containing protein n=1 Tax=Collybiopsis luxurians FD-317 M1 TaxID=944289 RepID=A0A0D0C1M8_9AGAR|nr:hypothetical protein GYMLUDRAFT_821873 [Collybiopsis luxurians FD-317 M1]